MAQRPDGLSDLDSILDAAGTGSPWVTSVEPGEREYLPDYTTLRDLLAVPIRQGHATSQQSGRVARSLDAYIAHELRRAGFRESEVFPRPRRPRVLSAELAPIEEAIENLLAALADHESSSGERLRPAKLRAAINKLPRTLRGSSDANILGRFYAKQVDVVVSDWRRGPDVLISGKSQFSSYLNNKNNRYEEAIGEAKNLRDRYPMAAMGYAYIVRSNVFEGGAFELLRDLLIRLRRPDGPFDATMLLVAEWDNDSLELVAVEDPAPLLSVPRFFADLLDALMAYTPVDVHPEIRRRKLGQAPPGGFPPAEGSVLPEA